MMQPAVKGDFYDSALRRGLNDGRHGLIPVVGFVRKRDAEDPSLLWPIALGPLVAKVECDGSHFGAEGARNALRVGADFDQR
jgi:hypothetical protein